MRTTRALAALGAAGALLVVTAPSAGAWDASTISVDPTVAGRGTHVAVNVVAPECSGGGTVYSSAFEHGSAPLSGTSNGGHANPKISHTASFGRHDVTVHCRGSQVTKAQALTVIGPAHGGTGGSVNAGATSTDIAIGTGLVAAAVAGGGMFWLRRRGESKA
ncbi:hypothetical protein H9Y04_14695 [Streptomyces sp. TRM66268-LWL]|uniref:Integral membrane protein n=1 Tax=Streptomyces polyasparticus TaxID=2767826 RepID=A0ABR7SGU0_9ACTN|nr:hypothetical protein [Streptomyces polyasparticus]MBC9713817.1 hypothetical protein [Streptomyces polyasparticus]